MLINYIHIFLVEKVGFDFSAVFWGVSVKHVSQRVCYTLQSFETSRRRPGSASEEVRWCRVPQISPDHVGTVLSLSQAWSSSVFLCNVRIQLNSTQSLSSLSRDLWSRN